MMRILPVFVLLQTVLTQTVFGQVTNTWSDTYAGSGARIYYAHQVLLDGSGNTYSAMAYQLNDSLLSSGNGGMASVSHPAGVVVGRYNNIGGNQNWVRTLADTYTRLAAFRSDASFNTYAAVTQASGNGSDRNIFVYRFNTSGTQTTLCSFSGVNANHDEADDMVLDNSGNILLAGSTNNAAEMLLLKYTGSGALTWQTSMALASSGTSKSLKMGTDASGNVFVLGKNEYATGSQYYLSSWLAGGIFNFSVPINAQAYLDFNFKDMAVDVNGNSYIVFTGSTGNNSYDVLLCKYDINGTPSAPVVYSCSGSSSSVRARVMNASAAGSLFFSFDNTSSSRVETRLLNSNGEVWIQNKNNASVRDVKTDAGGNLYVLTSVPGADGADLAVTKITSSGNVSVDITHDVSSVSGEDLPFEMAVSSAGIVTIAGMSGNDVPSDKTFLLRLLSSLNLSWTRVMFDYTDGSVSSCIHPVTQEVYVSGNSRNSNNVSDMYLLKYDSAGVEQWRLNFELPETDEVTASKQLALDASGNVFIAGYINASISSRNIIVYKISPAGIRLWKRTYNGLGNSEDIVASIATDAAGNLWLCGTTRATSLNRNILLLKYAPDGILLSEVNTEGPGAGEDVGKDLVVVGNSVFVVAEVTASGNQKDLAVYKYDASGNNMWHYVKSNVAGDDIASVIKHRDGILFSGSLFVSAGIYRGYAALINDSASGNPGLAFEKSFGDGLTNVQVNDADCHYPKITVAGFKGNNASSSCYVAQSDWIENSLWENSQPALPQSPNKIWNCHAVPQGQVFAAGTLRNASGDDDLSFFTFSSQGQIIQTLPVSSSASSIDQMSFTAFSVFCSCYAGQSNPQNNADGFHGLLALRNFPPEVLAPDTIYACGGATSETILHFLDEMPSALNIDLLSSQPALISPDSVSISIIGNEAVLMLQGVPDTTASLNITLTVSDGVNPSVSLPLYVSIIHSPESGIILGSQNVLEYSTHVFTPSMPSVGNQISWSFTSPLQSLQSSGDSVVIQFGNASGYLVSTTSNTCGSKRDSIFIQVQVPNLPPTLSLGLNYQEACGGSGPLAFPFTVGDEFPDSLSIVFHSSDSLVLQQVGVQGSGNQRVLTVEQTANTGSLQFITLTITDAAGQFVSDTVFISILPAPQPVSISGPDTVMEGSQHTYELSGYTNGADYQWLFNSNYLLSNPDSIQVSFQNSSGWLVYHTFIANCSSADSLFVFVDTSSVITSASGKAGKEAFGVFPTALMGNQSICIYSYFPWFSFRISDLSGQILLSGTGTGGKDEIFLTSFASGVYILQVEHLSHIFRKKFIVH